MGDCRTGHCGLASGRRHATLSRLTRRRTRRAPVEFTYARGSAVSRSTLAPRSTNHTSAHAAPSGALFTVALSAPAESPWLALTLSRSGDDADPDTAQTLPPLHMRPDELPALIAALDDVRRAHAAMG